MGARDSEVHPRDRTPDQHPVPASRGELTASGRQLRLYGRCAAVDNVVEVRGTQVRPARDPERLVQGADPVFWLHHAYIDKLWAEWQHLRPGSGRLPPNGTHDVVDLRETMKPWNDVRPVDLLDHTAYYTFGTD
ncbi:hypothetical protein GCM10022206_22390 [Streptomyces chiangmaiensis]